MSACTSLAFSSLHDLSPHTAPNHNYIHLMMIAYKYFVHLPPCS